MRDWRKGKSNRKEWKCKKKKKSRKKKIKEKLENGEKEEEEGGKIIGNKGREGATKK